ncbi:MFS transporter [Agrobacterium rosae]|uniref:MFS transporter n=1 Tax=Agrobacterium rosae TaxID=1972867 RepID=UPI0019D3BA7C|nr:MFS transporter [Agrobacterium rosae]MBN7808419.1 MFS transporter [Agrobacterium rosae]
MNEDPKHIIADTPMSRMQIWAIGLCVLLNALDGFDVLSISFASPGIAKDWGIDRGALGIVLSMELIGMAIGSVWLGSLCDRIGRRAAVLSSLVLMASGMFLAATASGIVPLSAWRLLTGLGIGGMLAATNAVAAEHANAKRRNFSIALMATGYPIGAVVGGALVSHFLVDYSWRAVFASGAIVTAFCIPLVYFTLPETVPWLIQRRPAGALERVNSVLKRMGRKSISALPEPDAARLKPGIMQLFAPALIVATVCLTLAYFFHIMTFYFILKWAPKIVADMGFMPSAAGNVLVWANIGGIVGSVVISLLSQRFAVRNLTIGVMVIATALVALFGRSAPDLVQLSLLAAIAGCATNAAVVGLYAIFAEAFPTEVRASGTGFVIGIGRGGAALSPILAGMLFANGASLPTVALLMGFGSTVAAIAILVLGLRSIGSAAPKTALKEQG